jgi:hypothetical protein
MMKSLEEGVNMEFEGASTTVADAQKIKANAAQRAGTLFP